MSVKIDYSRDSLLDEILVQNFARQIFSGR